MLNVLLATSVGYAMQGNLLGQMYRELSQIIKHPMPANVNRAYDLIDRLTAMGEGAASIHYLPLLQQAIEKISFAIRQTDHRSRAQLPPARMAAAEKAVSYVARNASTQLARQKLLRKDTSTPTPKQRQDGLRKTPAGSAMWCTPLEQKYHELSQIIKHPMPETIDRAFELIDQLTAMGEGAASIHYLPLLQQAIEKMGPAAVPETITCVSLERILRKIGASISAVPAVCCVSPNNVYVASDFAGAAAAFAAISPFLLQKVTEFGPRLFPYIVTALQGLGMYLAEWQLRDIRLSQVPSPHRIQRVSSVFFNDAWEISQSLLDQINIFIIDQILAQDKYFQLNVAYEAINYLQRDCRHGKLIFVNQRIRQELARKSIAELLSQKEAIILCRQDPKYANVEYREVQWLNEREAVVDAAIQEKVNAIVQRNASQIQQITEEDRAVSSTSQEAVDATAAAGAPGPEFKPPKDKKDKQKEKQETPTKVNNMNEFFRETEFGRSVKKKSDWTHYRYKDQRIHRVTEDIPNSPLKKGDLFYLDNSHEFHSELEVYNKFGKSKCVLNLDGTINEVKSLAARGRVIQI